MMRAVKQAAARVTAPAWGRSEGIHFSKAEIRLPRASPFACLEAYASPGVGCMELFPRRMRNRWCKRLARQTIQPTALRVGAKRRGAMDGLTGLAAVVMIFGMPTAVLGMYTFYRVRKLRTEERLAAMQRGVNIPMEADLSESARSRRAGILLVAGSVGYMLAFSIIARVEPDAIMAGAFGAIPFTLGLGYFLDSALIRRDEKAS